MIKIKLIKTKLITIKLKFIKIKIIKLKLIKIIKSNWLKLNKPILHELGTAQPPRITTISIMCLSFENWVILFSWIFNNLSESLKFETWALNWRNKYFLSLSCILLFTSILLIPANNNRGCWINPQPQTPQTVIKQTETRTVHNC